MKLKMFSKFFLVFLSLSLLLPFITEATVAIIGEFVHERSVENAEAYQGIIFVRNFGEEPKEIKVYQTDYLFFFNGTNIYGEPGKDPRSNAKWISFSPSRLTIPAKTTSAVSYTVKVPTSEDKTLPGTYWSMLMVEPISQDSPEVANPEKGKIKAGIRQNARYGIQMVTNLGNTGSRELKFLNTELLREKEKRILRIDIENVGERFLQPRLWVEIYKEETYIGRFEAGIRRTYPGTSVRFKIDLSGMPKGEYQALIVADCGGDDVFGMTHTLKLKD